MPGGDYYASPSQGTEVCKVQGPNCQQTPSQRLYCKTEGHSVLVCNQDLNQWRDRVASTSAERHRLELRCPMCADWQTGSLNDSASSPIKSTPVTVTLTGSAAEAIDRAMHAEGLLVDVRTRILQRLASDAPWLASCFVEPGSIAYLEDWLLTCERRAI